MTSKSLGQLTIDLVARTGGFVQGMSKAERESKKWRRQVEKDMQKVGKAAKVGLVAVSGAALGAGAALTKMTKDGLNAVDAQNKLARSLDTSYDSISALNIAFSESGVDGYEGSLNRLNRRLGAAEMGTGDAAKTVEALNLNLEQLSEMDVDERIATIADAMVDSGVSAQEAARHAQNLGFEQKEAAQMFLQGGDAIRAYREQIDDFGLSVSELDAVKVEQANDEFAKIGRLLDGISTQMAVQVAPILSAVSQILVQNAQDAGGLGEATAESFNVVIDGAARGVDALARLDRGFLQSQTAVDVFARMVRIGLLEVAREIVEIPTAAVNEMIMLVNNIPGVDIELFGMSSFGKTIQGAIDGTRQEIEDLDSDLRAILDTPLPGTQFKRLVIEARDAADESAAAILDAQEKINNARSESAGTGVNTVDVPDGSGGGLGGPKDVENGMAKRREALISAFQTERLAILAEYGRTQEEIKALEQVAIEDGGITQMQAADLRIKNEEAMQERLLQLRKDALDEEARLQQQRQALVLAGSEQLFGSLAQLTGTFAGEQTALYKTMFAVQKAASIAQAVVAIQTGIAQAAAVPFPANLAAMASVAAATAGIVGNIQSVGLNISGQAHDGIDSIPADGTWNLQKGERVVTAKTSAKLDATLDRVAKGQGNGSGTPIVNITENPNRAGEVSAKQNDDGQWVVDVIVADALNGGKAIRTYQSIFGFKRQGR